MNDVLRQRLFGSAVELWDPVTLSISGAIVVLVGLSGGLLWLLQKRKILAPETATDAFGRWKSWTWLSLCMLLPVLLGPVFTIAAVTLLSLGGYREFARATGLFRHFLISTAVVAGILLVNFAVLDHFDRLFFATAPLTIALVTVLSIPQDRPTGYLQRIALGAIGFLLFGFSFAYIGNMTNAPGYRPFLLLMLLAVSSSDIFAYCFGKAFSRHPLLPNTSPGKTVENAMGSLALTTLLVMAGGHFVFAGTPMGLWYRLLMLGLLIGFLGQLGDLVVSSIKRDVGIKDTGVLIPGHGGLLDRFDSLLLVPPAVYHFLSLHLGPLGEETPARILTGG